MKFSLHSPRQRKRGFTITEATVALFLLASAAVLLSQLTLAVRNVGRQTWRMQLVQEELANLAEQTTTLQWDELTEQRIGQLELGELILQEYPAAKLRVKIESLAEARPGKQLTLRLDLGEHAPTPQLTIWRFPTEAKP